MASSASGSARSTSVVEVPDRRGQGVDQPHRPRLLDRLGGTGQGVVGLGQRFLEAGHQLEIQRPVVEPELVDVGLDGGVGRGRGQGRALVGHDGGGPGLMAEHGQEAGRAAPGVQRPPRGLEVLVGPRQQGHRLIGSVVPQGIQAVTDLVGGLPQLALGLHPGVGQSRGSHDGQAGNDEADDRDPSPDPPPRAEVGGHEHGRDRGGRHQGRQAGVVASRPAGGPAQPSPPPTRRAAGTGDAVRRRRSPARGPRAPPRPASPRKPSRPPRRQGQPRSSAGLWQ